MQSGVANTASALVQLLGLVFGVGIGRSIAASWFGPAKEVVPAAAFSAPYVLAAVVTGLAFTLTLRARYRDAPLMCIATVLALVANEVGRAVFGREAAVFVAALTVGIVGGLLGSRLRRSPLVFIVPGVLMLVPGSAGFNSALQLLSNQTVSGITAAFDTFVTAMSIAYGLIVSVSLIPGHAAVVLARRRRRRVMSRAASMPIANAQKLEPTHDAHGSQCKARAEDQDEPVTDARTEDVPAVAPARERRPAHHRGAAQRADHPDPRWPGQRAGPEQRGHRDDHDEPAVVWPLCPVEAHRPVVRPRAEHADDCDGDRDRRDDLHPGAPGGPACSVLGQ